MAKTFKYTNDRGGVFLGDCRMLLDEYPDAFFDLCVTSPPYNLSINYDQYNDRRSFGEYYEQLFPLLDLIYRKMKVGGRLCLNIMPFHSGNEPTHIKIAEYLSRQWLWKTEIWWEKGHYNCAPYVFGSWMMPSAPYIKTTNEYVYVFCKENLQLQDKGETDLTRDEFVDWTSNNKWVISPSSKGKIHGHPAMMPEELVVRLVKLFSWKGAWVLDPFNGVGTTTTVCQRLDRHFIGMEMSDKYFETSVWRHENLGKLF